MSEPFLDRLHDELRAAAWREIEGERRPQARRTVPLLRPLVAAAVVAAIVFAGVRALHADDAAVSPSRAHSAFESALTEHLNVLRRAPTSRDSVPGDVPRPLQGSPIPAVDYAGALRLADGVWAVPHGSQACLLRWKHGGGSLPCAAPPKVMGGGLFTVELRPKTIRVWGLLPDGAHDVTLTRSHGSPVSITLSDGNFYAASVPGNPRHLRFTGASGNRHTVEILPVLRGKRIPPGATTPNPTPTPAS
jgi:hypothetical protein